MRGWPFLTSRNPRVFTVAIEWLSSGYRVAIEWLSCDGQQAATIPDVTTEFLMQSLEGFLQPQIVRTMM